MGYWSNKHVEVTQYGQRWLEIEKKSVCSNCLVEPGLAKFIEKRAIDGDCTYCGANAGVASVGDLIPHIHTSLSLEWTPPESELPIDPDTGEWMFGGPTSTHELLGELIFSDYDGSVPDGLCDDITSTIPYYEMAEVDALRASQTEYLTNSWEAFSHIVKHERRFFFNVDASDKIVFRRYYDEVELGPLELLNKIVEFLNAKGRMTTVEKGWQVKRCRQKEKGSPSFSASEMGPPPRKFATQPNRMSPSGVSMFYGAPEQEVCLREITSEPGFFASATFEVDREIRLVDLTGEISIPSLFDEDENSNRPLWQFIKYFLKDFRKPIEKDGREHIEYVPTQVVSEFFRSLSHPGIGKISGILYDSAQLPGQAAVVLFADNSCIAGEDIKHDSEQFSLTMVDYEELEFTP